MTSPIRDQSKAIGALRSALDALELAAGAAAAELEEAQLACTHPADIKRLGLAEDALLRASGAAGSAAGFVTIIERARARRAWRAAQT